MTLQREEIKEQRRRDENQKNLVDLDEIIEKWVRFFLRLTCFFFHLDFLV